MREFNLLVVDDDRIYLNLIELLFKEVGLKALCVDSGEKALEIIKDQPIGLIFTDYHMPGMNGLELAVRVLDIAPDARIVMTTSDPSPEVTSLAMRVGISSVTAKPYKLEHILDIIDGEKQWLIDSFREGLSTQGKEEGKDNL